MMKNLKYLLLLGVLNVTVASAQERLTVSDPNAWIAIVGDSAASGAVTHPKLKPKVSNLLPKVIRFLTIGYESVPKLKYIPNPDRFNITAPLESPTRITHSAEEYAEALKNGEGRALLRNGRAARVVDTPEYTFGYFVGRKIRVKATDIVFVGQDGQRVDAISKQIDRLTEMQEPNLPPLMFISFTANDLCDNDIFNESVETRAQKFETELRQQFARVFARHSAHPSGTRVFVLAPLDVMNILTNPALLEQKTDFQGLGKIKCRQLREGPLQSGLLSETMRSAMVGMCSSVLGTKLTDHERMQKIRSVQAAFGQAWQKLIAEFQAGAAPRGFNFQYIESVRRIPYETGDLGNDCFHPGIGAHQKIADRILNFLKPDQQ